MIMTVAELKQFVTTSESDSGLESRLQALEILIRKYTNNNFQKREIRSKGRISGGILYCDTTYLKNGNTIQISESKLNDGLVVIGNMQAGAIPLADSFDEDSVLVTLVVYPHDVKMGVVNMMKWELENRAKMGIASETISRHSVTYISMDGDNSTMGFPKSVLGFLKPYMKAKF